MGAGDQLEMKREDSDELGTWKKIRNYFREYCVCSSIHGFRYFGEKRTYFERQYAPDTFRFWWFVVFSIIFGICIYLIREVYYKWDRSPVIVSFATSETQIYTIPFPAVTICPEAKTTQSIYNHSAILQKLMYLGGNLTDEELQKAFYMSMICDNDDFDITDFYPEKLDRNTTGTVDDKDFFAFLQSNMTLTDLMMDCSFMGQKRSCEEMFVPIITDEGICYSFNVLDRSQIYQDTVVHYDNYHEVPDSNTTWNMDDGYPDEDDEADIQTYPHRAMFAGAKNSLSVALVTVIGNMDYTCKQSLQGFRVALHTPMRIPRPSQQYFRVPLNEVVLGSIQPEMIITEEMVKMFNPKKRECYFPSERNLRYFKIYTQLNCGMECLTNYTLANCGCVNFYMPRDNHTKICGAASKNCLVQAEQRLQLKDLGDKLKRKQDSTRKSMLGEIFSKWLEDTDNAPKNKDLIDSCDCMPICNDLSYNVETSQSQWDWRAMYNVYFNGSMPFNATDVHISKLNLYFKTSQFITSKRHELYGLTDFIANFGGLLGLFTGFSMLSLMEIFYFLTVRLCCNVRLYGLWSGPNN